MNKLNSRSSASEQSLSHSDDVWFARASSHVHARAMRLCSSAGAGRFLAAAARVIDGLLDIVTATGGHRPRSTDIVTLQVQRGNATSCEIVLWNGTSAAARGPALTQLGNRRRKVDGPSKRPLAASGGRP